MSDTFIIENVFPFITSLIGAGFGAFFAYKFNLRQERILDKQNNDKQLKAIQENRSVIFSYLIIYYRMHISNLMRIENYFAEQKKLWKKIVANEKLTEHEKNLKRCMCLGYTMEMQNNYDELKFTAHFPAFLGTMMMYETGYDLLVKLIKQYNSNIDNSSQLRYLNACNIYNLCLSKAYDIYIIVKLIEKYNDEYMKISYIDIDYSVEQRKFIARAIKEYRNNKKTLDNM